jgi:mersacidin/lichenicidin family type 2 lantibiotic
MAGIQINNLDIDIIRAWKDEDYLDSLSEEQRAQLPENPAGMVELLDEDMGAVVGGLQPIMADDIGGGCSCNCCVCTCIT